MEKRQTPFDSNRFREVSGRFATGITIVTARAGNQIHGLTVNAFCSVSLQPALVLICVDKKAQSHDLIIAGGCFAVNLLGASQQELAERFADNFLQSEQRFSGIEFHQEVTGAPILNRSLGWLDCKTLNSYEGGDHTIFVGEVMALGAGAHEPPLLFFRSRYHHPEKM